MNMINTSKNNRDKTRSNTIGIHGGPLMVWNQSIAGSTPPAAILISGDERRGRICVINILVKASDEYL